MATPRRATIRGTELHLLMSDGSTLRGLRDGVATYRLPVIEDGPGNGGTGGWHNPLGTPHAWGTYEDGGGSHSGGAMDFGLGYGAEVPLIAACDGTIIYAGWENGGGGNCIIIQPAGASEGIVYAHLNKIDVAVGDVVKGGQHVGVSGWTGTVIPSGPAGAHLHLEVRVNGTQWGPWYRAYDYFLSKGVNLGPGPG